MRHRKLVLPVVIGALLLITLPLPVKAADRGTASAKVCIDPGHGGNEPGAIQNGVQEKDVNLAIALKAKPLLQQLGYEVVMTRETDIDVSLEGRCQIANRNCVDAFVSIHNNAYLTTSEGTETYCYFNSEEGRRLATDVHSNVIKRIGLTDRGVKEADFYVLRNTDMPSALLEGAFLTNPEEARLLTDPAFQQKIAEGVAAGVHEFMTDPGRFDEYILLMNPDWEKAAEVELVYMTGTGDKQVQEQSVPPRSRQTVHVDESVRNADVSALVRSTNGVPVVCERAVYFNFEKGRGGHGSPGVLAPSSKWYLAEGSTDWGFSTYVLVQNPGDETSDVTMRFMRSDGFNASKDYEMAPHSRFTLDVSSVGGFEKADFSVEVTSAAPVVAERALYFSNHNAMSGGHNSPGVNEPAYEWYLAEGYTGKGFDTYILIANPNDSAACITATYLLSDGETVEMSYELNPGSRRTVHLNEVPGLEERDVSTKLRSDKPVIVERSMYFDYFGIKEGNNSVASKEISCEWYMAEGYTGGGYDTYILLSNPGHEKNRVSLEFMIPDGTQRRVWIDVPPLSRKTVKVDDVEGMDSTEFSTYVSSAFPLVAERSMYFLNTPRAGGHNSTGVTAPSLVWYFAEGCTR
ncbi:MAG: N-acetylmuramoyl-L-alanine amidase [Actinobacteria bacterium]|nr:N-acetylmuramoyl-L-alanine amidase [Actinomycetota bacterium]